ncbi:MAG: hypothetical protein IT281_05710 [Ignavibacteria bacterium]|nr:hypothetical protein [Ignavibacteria bacterium]
MKIDENCWTLMDNGYYVRPKPGGSKTKLDIYRPEQVSVTYDEKGRVKTMSSPVGILEIEYDDNSGADIISYPSSNSYKINRISGIKLDGEPIGKLWKMLWYSTIDSRTSQTSQYKRKEIGIVTDPLEAWMVYRDVKIKNHFEYFNKFNNNIKLSSEDEKELYELKQLEYCMKFVADSMRFQVKEESIEKIIRIATDAAVGQFSEKVKSVSPKGGSQSDGGFGFGFNVAIPGNNAQRIGVTGQGSEEGNDPGPPPITINEDPSTPTRRDTTRDPVDCRIDLKQVDMNLLPGPNQLFMAWFEIECNRPIQEIQWRLFSVSKENGRYCNDKEPAFYKTEPDPDFSIDPLENDQYDIVIDETGATATGQRNAPHMVFVKAHDYGAFGKLSLSVKVDGVYYDAICEGWENNFINIPYDLNDNKIADKWEMENGVSMTFADTDAESTSPMHETYGDGMTVYDEYRGFYLFGAEGFNYHKRMDPLKKEMFIIDPDLIVPLIAWKRLTQIEVYRLTPELVYGDLAGSDILQYKWVNFGSGFSAGSKYCLKVENVVGLEDPYGRYPGHHVFGYCTEEIPKRVERTVIFPDRVAKYMRETYNSLTLILSESGESETITIRGRAWDRDFIQKTVDWLRNESSFDYFHRFFMDQVVIHEMGHGCSISHHSAGTGTGDAQCVMRYFYDMEYAESFLFMFSGVAGGLLHDELSSEELMYVFTRAPYVFCSTPDNCFGQININDRTP